VPLLLVVAPPLPPDPTLLLVAPPLPLLDDAPPTLLLLVAPPLPLLDDALVVETVVDDALDPPPALLVLSSVPAAQLAPLAPQSALAQSAARSTGRWFRLAPRESRDRTPRLYHRARRHGRRTAASGRVRSGATGASQGPLRRARRAPSRRPAATWKGQ
jgi:hypothetical protein